MNLPLGACRQLTDQARRDAAWEKALAEAWQEFEAGDYNQEIYDLMADDPTDVTEIALALCFPKRAQSAVINSQDFRSTIESVVEKNASRKYEYLA